DAAPTWLPYPSDVNALLDGLWSQTTVRGDDGALTTGGVSVHDIAEQVGTPACVVGEEDFRGRAARFRDALGEACADRAGAAGFDCGKACLGCAVAQWMQEEGLGLDVCRGGALAAAPRAGFPADRMACHGNDESRAELRRALEVRIGRLVVDSLDEID